MSNIKQFGSTINGCNCGNNNVVQNGFIEDLSGIVNTKFFDEIFPKDSKGNRALVTRVEIDTPSLLKFGAIVIGAIVIFKKL